MCLDIDLSFHGGSSTNKLRSRVAKRNIVVWKILRKRGNDYVGRYQSQYKWTFGVLHTEPRLPKTRNLSRSYLCFDADSIYEGLHSCRSYADAHLRHYSDSTCKIFPAIIPAGSRLWFGDSSDIVSDHLIVFKNMDDLEKVYGKITEPVKERTLSKVV